MVMVSLRGTLLRLKVGKYNIYYAHICSDNYLFAVSYDPFSSGPVNGCRRHPSLVYATLNLSPGHLLKAASDGQYFPTVTVRYN